MVDTCTFLFISSSQLIAFGGANSDSMILSYCSTHLLLDLFIVSSIFGSANDLIISYSVQRCFSNFTAKHIITNNPIFTLLIYPSFLISYKDLWISLYLFSLQVGLPNVGKSTFFNIVTKLSIPAENFPFCTIDPNEARVYVPDERFDWLCQLYKPKSEVCFFPTL